ncbi:NADH:flavin oxidoreductase/NADH oxidase [Neorhizobium alkalisoli]|uniref:2,4-dienoyl-CoA reductase-like NADH-dependent reductase (Old Yellow Enzyme family) n=1 Tax=Neorhizobium alkalisoli TaxID=528178 RepID=A0A561Q7Z3_9HYPH|nr:NADH:flavin oxidoreductase/NADH oxidase [Neorhizobium alkalisoli]TWF46460.1 2,4-dienoyl-CoA reductase-like NADH-dependent reductase (Old Yellow Enzyme family) [Neorhizobium alkalisoli]
MSTAALFEPITVRDLNLSNRIVIAPMCQYSAEEGCMSDWHLIHLGKLALSGAALLTIEATAVVPEGRITYADLGLWNEQTYTAMGLVLESIRRWTDIPIGIQLSHAGRKASTEVPWKGGRQFAPTDGLGWPTFAPSPLPYADGQSEPRALDRDGLSRVRQGFVSAAVRAVKLGIDLIQIHAAHGYLLHQFLSPLSNHRTDEYGGSLANRMRFPLEVFDAVREAVPGKVPVSVRLSATDWVAGGWDIEQSQEFAVKLQDRGCDALHVTSGGLHPAQRIAARPGYQVPFARSVKQAVTIPVVAVGLITGFDQAEAIISTGDADMIALARTILYDPNWPWHAAAHLGGRVKVPPQYMRSQPSRHRDLFATDLNGASNPSKRP